MASKEIICIVCPVGCHLTVTEDAEGVLKVEGNGCIRGREYGIKEYTRPERVVTTSVWVEGGLYPLVSVKTENPIPKSKVFDVLSELAPIVLKAPVPIGKIILANAAGTGVNVVATREVAVQE